MICIGSSRISHLAVGNNDVIAAYLGSDSTFDYLPYLFEAPKLIWLLTAESSGDGDIESNTQWNINF